MSSEPDQIAVVRSILELAETLHLETVAEGIEGQAQLDALRGLDAQMGQGFLFAEPLEAQQIAAVLAAHKLEPIPDAVRPTRRPMKLPAEVFSTSPSATRHAATRRRPPASQARVA